MAAVVATTVSGVFVDVGRALRESFFMFWETLWPLVLGFGLSGAVQAFVERAQMLRAMGDHRPAAVVRASAFGMASSSCSYAAAAMAKSLFQKGADLVSALVFMFASTNLVFELGAVIVVLLGWQFAAAEFVGGPVMIALLAVIGGFVLRAPLVEAARRRLAAGDEDGGHDHHVGDAGVEASPDEPAAASWSGQLRSLSRWSDAAIYTMSDLTMLRRELVIGYVVAGALAVLVPSATWNTVFLHGHGMWTTLENAVVGPVIAFLSFVCSIGNVPMAAALWKGGSSFGGVVSFLFADLLAAPLVLIYRRYYGGALTVRLVLLFWALMSAAGLVVGVVFSGAGLVPSHRPVVIAQTALRWDATTILNIVSVGLFGFLYWLYRNRERLGGGAGLATDPVCGMQVRLADGPARRTYHGTTYRFCSDRCAEQFAADPERYCRPETSATLRVVTGEEEPPV